MQQHYSKTKTKIFSAVLGMTFYVIFTLTGFSSSSQTISFKNYTLESGTALTQGAVYRFSNITSTGNVDALVTVTELNRVLLKHIDSMFTGADDGFQPMLSSTGGKGEHYALFNITFVTSGTTVPLDLLDFSGTVFDLNGSNQINEYADVTLENGSWEYSGSNPGIAVTQSGNVISGVSQNSDLSQTIDTSNKANSFQISSPAVSSLTVKFGFNQAVNGWSGNDQFSLLFHGRSSLSLLSVVLHDFIVDREGTNVQLSWITSNETAFSHYVVERSENGVDFKDVSVIFANKRNRYEYLDNVEKTGNVYYRLRMVDLTNKFKRSSIKVINLTDAITEATIKAFPNPTHNQLYVSIPDSWVKKTVSYSLYSLNGNLLQTTVRPSASHSETMLLAGQKPGLYFLKVSSGTQTVMQRILKTN